MSLPQILTTTGEIEAFARQLQGNGEIAVDLEADSMHHYREQVCLLQFTAGGETVLIDPLAGASLDALKPLLADVGVRKIFHAADYDIRCLARDFGIEIGGLFDTMISCQFLGEERFGLADVLNKYFGVELDKKFQRADWTQRPLSEGMIRYAAADTAHLSRLVEILEAKLVEMGRRDWVAEEFRLLEQARFAEAEGPMCLRFKGAGRLPRRQLGILEELLLWRDGEACRRDLPHFKVLGNKALLDLAVKSPKAASELNGIEGLPPRLVDRYGSQLLAAVERGLVLPEEKLPLFPRGERREKDPAVEKRLTQLKEWRSVQAKDLAIDPGVLINNATLEQLARAFPRNRTELTGLEVLKNWQLQEFGDDLLNAL